MFRSFWQKRKDKKVSLKYVVQDLDVVFLKAHVMNVEMIKGGIYWRIFFGDIYAPKLTFTLDTLKFCVYFVKNIVLSDYIFLWLPCRFFS